MKKERFYNNIERWVIVSFLIVMTVILTVNIITRFFFSYTFSWSEQLTRLMLVWISFAGISWAGKIDAHMRVTAISLALSKHKKLMDGVLFFGDMVAAAYGFYMSYKIFGIMVQVMNQGQVFSAMTFMPKWLMYLAGVLGMAGLGARILQRRYCWLKERKAAKEVEAQ